MTRVYAPDGQGDAGRMEVHGDEAHHLVRVVRVRVGEIVGVFDGRGHEWRARVAAVGKTTVSLAVEATVVPVPEPAVRVTLGVGVLKGDQMDTVIRDATVMGAAAIVPLATDHVTVPSRAWNKNAAQGRWHRVAVAAAKQSGRAVVPDVKPVADVAEFLQAGAGHLSLVCLEPATGVQVTGTDWRQQATPANVSLIIGPEGGWSAAEVAAFDACGALAISLGPRTLRAESAPAVALTLLWATWGW